MNANQSSSPVPWSIHRYTHVFLGEKLAIVRQGESRKSLVCDIGPTEFSPGRHECEANAELIIQAVNNHSQLVAALLECEKRMTRIACGELSGVTAKASAKNGLETIEHALTPLKASLANFPP